MKLKWQWFLGGRVMFWVVLIMMIVMAFGFFVTYVIDPVKTIEMKEQSVDATSIKNISESYIKELRNRN